MYYLRVSYLRQLPQVICNFQIKVQDWLPLALQINRLTKMRFIKLVFCSMKYIYYGFTRQTTS